ncbi:hypothetical protein PSHT_09730, partial [Puccinia striiformis]
GSAELYARAAILLLLAVLADPRSISIIVFLKKNAMETRELTFQILFDFQDNICYSMLQPFFIRCGLNPMNGFCEGYTTYALFALALVTILKAWNPCVSWLKQEWEHFCDGITTD